MGESPGRTFVRSGVRPPSLTDVDWQAAPLHFKLYRACARIPLPLPPTTPAQPGGASPLTRDRLGALLWATYGATRLAYIRADDGEAREAPTHLRHLRPVPSGGALYPCEMYVLARAVADLPAGVYHYDGLHHCLERLRAGAHAASPEGLLAHSDAPPAACTLVLSCLFWKDGFKYGAFGYRLQSLDLGAVLAQTQLAAAAHGLAARTHYRFLDRPLDALLGLDPSYESAYAVVTLADAAPASRPTLTPTPRSADRRPTRRAAAPAALPAIEADPLVSRARVESIACWPLCAAVHFASLRETVEAYRPRGALAPIAAPAAPAGWCDADVALPHVALECHDLYAARAGRRSAAGKFVPVSISQHQLAQLLDAGMSGYPNDVDDRAGTLQHTLLYCVVNAVEGVGRGVYRYDPDGPALRRILAGDVRAALQASATSWLYNLFGVSLCVFAVGHYEAGFALFGDRWYRMQNMEAGIATQRLYLAASVLGLGCRASLGFHVPAADHLLELPEGYTSLIQILLGHEWQASSAYEQSVTL